MKRINFNISSLISCFNILSFVLLFLLSLSPLRSQAAVITVPGDYSTIQAAINASSEGDEIIASPGTYYENINFLGKNIILRSTDPTNPDVAAGTIIDGRSSDTVITFSGTELPVCMLSGFTITNGYALNGGGINGNHTRATINDNSIKANTAYGWYPDGLGGGLWQCGGTIQNNTILANLAYNGGGLSHCQGLILNNTIAQNNAYGGGGLSECDGTVQNNTISGNSADSGGGLYHCDGSIQLNTISSNSAQTGGGLVGCEGTIQNNTISGNSASSSGGGLNRCGGTIQNNIISGNSASWWGGGLQYCTGTIKNNTIYANSAQHRGGGFSDCNAAIRNCIIWNNTAPRNSQLWDCSAPSYSCIQDWRGGGIGNISDQPLLFDPDNGDFHLDYDSACIDAGCYIDDLAEDFEGDSRGYDGSPEARGDGSEYDIGVDEFIAIPSNNRPHKPVNLWPANGEVGVSLPPILESSAFSDPDPGDIHTASQWQIDNNSDFSSPEYDSYTDFFNKTTIMALSKDVICRTGYCYWRVRHRDNHGYWSEWSDSTSFLTLPPRVITVPGDYSTIQAAIDAAWGGDTIIVSPGTYRENINFKGKNIILRSGDPTGPSVVASTIIDGNTSGSVVTFSGTESSLCVLSGFTTTNGYGPNGGGICGNGTLATIQHNIISGNFAGDYGGGLYDCHGVIQNNIISGNSGSYGGGLYYCDGTIQNNTVSGNSAQAFGGGISNSHGIIRNNTIWDNSANGDASNGGGLNVCSGIIQNNTIYGNSAKYGGGLYGCDGFIINCIIWANSAHTGSQLYSCSSPFYSCIQNWTGGGRGNISADPQFANPAAGDFHLQPGSPCIDAGNTYYLFGDYIADIDGECRLLGSSVDMGSDEYGSSLDSDGDLMADINEATQGSNPNNPDTDGDGLKDGVEVKRGTSPTFYNIPPGISVPAQYSSIQQALFMAFPSEVIVVEPGTYKENLHFLGKDLILQSTNPLDQNIVDATVIDGDALYSVMVFAGNESQNCIIKGLTIQNGSAACGGGIRGNGTLATIERNKILSNMAYSGGGGLYRCQGTIGYNVISGNESQNGAGLYDCGGNIKNNTINNNRAYVDGAGLYDCDGVIENNIIIENQAEGFFSRGGGLCECDGIIQNNRISENHCSGQLGGSGAGLYNCNGIIQNNIISGNYIGGQARCGGGLARCNGIIQNNTIYDNRIGTLLGMGGGLFGCEGIIRNCIIWQNEARSGPQLYECSAPSYSCIQDWTGDVGNISEDPRLVNPYRGDFHLSSNSPCIDAGCSISGLMEDFEGDGRPWRSTSEFRGDGSGFDIGADECVGALHYEFTASEEGWTSSTVEVFSAPQWLFEPGGLKLISQSNTNTFGFWVSPENAIPVSEGYLYRARFTVSTDVAMPEIVPQIRLRVNSRNFQQADCLIIDSSGDGGASPTPDGITYDLYFVPPTNDEYCMLAFDLLNFNPYDAARAELCLESVLVERFRLDTLDGSTTITWTYDFETSQEFWFPGDGTFAFTDPEFFWSDGALHLRSTTNTNSFGYWHSDPMDIIIEEDCLYRGIFEVRTDETDPSRVPQMRLRFNTANLQASRSLEIASIGDGANSPGTTNTTYDRLYFLPPPNCVGKGLIVSFDILNFDPADAAEASLILDRAIIETLSPPALP